MIIKKLLASTLVAIVLLSGCKKDEGTNNPPPPSNGLTATPASVRLLPGSDASVAISGSTRPDSILIQSDPAVATVVLSDTTLTVHAVALGSTSIRVGDNSPTRKTVDIAITVATSPAAFLLGRP